LLLEGSKRSDKLSDKKTWQGGKEGMMLESLQQAGGVVGRKLGRIWANFSASVVAGFRICRSGGFVRPRNTPSQPGVILVVTSQPCR